MIMRKKFCCLTQKIGKHLYKFIEMNIFFKKKKETFPILVIFFRWNLNKNCETMQIGKNFIQMIKIQDLICFLLCFIYFFPFFKIKILKTLFMKTPLEKNQTKKTKSPLFFDFYCGFFKFS